MSKRHHYLPVHFINGFTNAEGFVYAYDKIRGKISDKKYFPKSMFFENDRNSFSYEEKKISALEDHYYQGIDSMHAPIIAKMRNGVIKDKFFDNEIMGGVSSFIISQFFRFPKNDWLFDYYYDKTKLKASDNPNNLSESEIDNILKKAKSSEYHKQMAKADIINEIFKRTMSQKGDKTFYHKLVEISNSQFLLGDYPIIYKDEPINLSDISNNEVYLPISSNRMYSTASNCKSSFSHDVVLMINAIIIHQSEKYICSPDRDFLSKCVIFYNEFNKGDLIKKARELLFTY